MELDTEELTTTQQDTIRMLELNWNAEVIYTLRLDGSKQFHIFGLKVWNFIPEEVLELIQKLGTIKRIVTENLEFQVKARE